MTQRVNKEIETYDLKQLPLDNKWMNSIPANVANRRQILPILKLNGRIHVACSDLNNVQGLQFAKNHFKEEITPILVEAAQLREKIKELNLSATRVDQDLDSTVQASNDIFEVAQSRGASDIHIDVDKEYAMIRFRIDGLIEDYQKLTLAEYQPLMSRLKILAKMDIAEKRFPQDGYIKYESANSKLELRAATLPTKYGEKMTLRLMNMGSASLSLEKIGMLPEDLVTMEMQLAKPHGIILLTGPTGSGKSTTLYSALVRTMNGKQPNIITIEDPVEYDLENVSQVQVDNEKITFADALKSVLRHDPDIIMVGEIRDAETASIAIKAAITGHLVLSTLHTNSAPSVITRLIDMGVESFLLAATLRLAVAQRLVRKLCSQCSAESTIHKQQAFALGNLKLEGEKCREAIGCIYCAGKGYTGRLGLFEMLEVTPEITQLVSQKANESAINEMMKKQGGNTLMEDGVKKILTGHTSISEVLKVCTVD